MSSGPSSTEVPILQHQHDWGRVTPPDAFYGRQQELTQAIRGLVHDRRRRLVIAGVGGMGKTALAWRVAHQLQDQYRIIWRSLADFSTPSALLQSLWQTLAEVGHNGANGTANGTSSGMPTNGVTGYPTASSRLAVDTHETTGHHTLLEIVHHLDRQPCLMVLDGFDVAFQPGADAGTYRAEYEVLGDFVRLIQERSHTSRLLLTSREVPLDVSLLDRPESQVLFLAGLPVDQGRRFFDAVLSPGSTRSVAEHHLTELMDWFVGNPMALQAASATIQTVLNRNIARFMEQARQGYLPSSVQDMVADHLARLSPREREVVYWLAIAHEPVSHDTLQTDLAGRESKLALPDTLESLMRRSLIHDDGRSRFSLPLMMMNDVLKEIVQRIIKEVESGELDLFLRHALVKIDASEHIQTLQRNRILRPIAEALHDSLRYRLETHLAQILNRLHEKYRVLSDYGSGNLINLYLELGFDLENKSFAGLTIRQARLHGASFAHVDFSRADFSQCAFANRLGEQPVVALDHQGELLAVGDRQGALSLWHTRRNQQRPLWTDADSGILCLAFDPTGRWLASGHTDHRIYLWDVATDSRFTTLMTDGAVTCLMFSPCGTRLMGGTTRGRLHCWNLNESQQIYALEAHAAAILALDLNPDGDRLVSLSETYEMSVWQAATGDRLTHIQASDANPVKALFFVDDDRVLYLCSEEGLLKLMDLASGQLIGLLQGHHDTVGHVAVGSISSFEAGEKHEERADASNGRLNRRSSRGMNCQLATSSSDQTLRVWDLSTGQSRLMLRPPEGQVTSLSLMPQVGLLASGGDRAVCLWETTTGHRQKALGSQSCRVFALTLSPDGSLLAVGNDDCTLKFWDIRTDTYLRTLRGHVDWISAIVFSPDHRWCASGSDDGALKLWEVESGRCVRSLPGHQQTVRAIAFSPDGYHLASVSDDRRLKIWHLETGACIKNIFAHDDRIHTVRFSPDGKTIATGSADHTISLWDVSSGDERQSALQGHGDRIHTLAFSQTGDRLLSGSDDQTVRLWNLTTGECIHQWNEGVRKIHAVTFNSRNQPIACASICTSVEANPGATLGGTNQPRRQSSPYSVPVLGIWNLASGHCIESIPDELELTLAIFSTDGETLVGVDSQDEVALWPYADVSSPQRFAVNQPYHNMNITGVRGISDAQKSVLRSLGAVER